MRPASARKQAHPVEILWHRHSSTRVGAEAAAKSRCGAYLGVRAGAIVVRDPGGARKIEGRGAV